MDEQYRLIKGFPGYRVSDDGVVESCWTRGYPRRLSGDWRPLKPIAVGGGYRAVNLHRGGEKHRRYIHRLVLEAFDGPCPPGLVCRHLDGDPANNRRDNLEWGTYAQNEADKLRHGTRARGEAARSKLTEEEVLEIRRLRTEGVPIRLLASDYAVTPQNIEAIVAGKTWRHLLPSDSPLDPVHPGSPGSDLGVALGDWAAD